jgi:hypothetical protein
MAVQTAPHVVLTVKDPLGKTGLDNNPVVIFLVDQGGTKTAQTLNKLVCQHFKIEEQEEKEMFKAALFSYPNLLDTVKLTRDDGVVYKVSLGGVEREKMKNPQNVEQDIKLKPEKLLVHTKVGIGNEALDVYHYACSNQIADLGDAAVTFFNCHSFKELAQFNHQHHFSKTMVKIDLTKRPRSRL